MYNYMAELVKFWLNYSVVKALLNDSTTFSTLSFNRATSNLYADVIFYTVESSRIFLRKPKLIQQDRCNTFTIIWKN